MRHVITWTGEVRMRFKLRRSRKANNLPTTRSAIARSKLLLFDETQQAAFVALLDTANSMEVFVFKKGLGPCDEEIAKSCGTNIALRTTTIPSNKEEIEQRQDLPGPVLKSLAGYLI